MKHKKGRGENFMTIRRYYYTLRIKSLSRQLAALQHALDNVIVPTANEISQLKQKLEAEAAIASMLQSIGPTVPNGYDEIIRELDEQLNIFRLPSRIEAIENKIDDLKKRLG